VSPPRSASLAPPMSPSVNARRASSMWFVTP
jgi:hypothetical protein